MGGICVREGVKMKPFRVGGTGIRTFDKEQPDEMPTLLEAGTLNMPGIAGLRAGVEYILEKGTDVIWQQADAYARAFYEGVKHLPGVRLYGDFDADVRTPVVTLNLKDYDSAAVADELMQRFDIAVRSGGTVRRRCIRPLEPESRAPFASAFLTLIPWMKCRRP